MSVFKDLTGQRFGKLTVVERTANNSKGDTRWLCRCDCGKLKVVISYSLTSGKTKSCGCLRKSSVVFAHKAIMTHGKSDSRIYKEWQTMKNRCCNANSPVYTNYGGRGITVCDRWRDDFQAFYDWAVTHGYADNLTIDRIDVNGNYEPNNCQWVTQKAQANNRRTSRFITYNGETQTLAQWAEITGINYNTLRSRLNANKWTVEKILNTP